MGGYASDYEGAGLLADEFAQLVLLKHMSTLDACAQLGIPPSRLPALRQSAAYKKLYQDRKKALAASRQEHLAEIKQRMDDLHHPIVDRFEKIITDQASQDSDAIKAGNSVLDRSGFPRHVTQEQVGKLELDDATIQALTAALTDAAKVQAIDIDWTDLTPARVSDPRTHRDADGRTPAALTHDGTAVGVLHGEGGDRVHRPGPAVPRPDEPVDREADDPQTGLSPA